MLMFKLLQGLILCNMFSMSMQRTSHQEDFLAAVFPGTGMSGPHAHLDVESTEDAVGIDLHLTLLNLAAHLHHKIQSQRL